MSLKKKKTEDKATETPESEDATEETSEATETPESKEEEDDASDTEDETSDESPEGDSEPEKEPEPKKKPAAKKKAAPKKVTPKFGCKACRVMNPGNYNLNCSETGRMFKPNVVEEITKADCTVWLRFQVDAGLLVERK